MHTHTHTHTPHTYQSYWLSARLWVYPELRWWHWSRIALWQECCLAGGRGGQGASAPEQCPSPPLTGYLPVGSHSWESVRVWGCEGVRMCEEEKERQSHTYASIQCTTVSRKSAHGCSIITSLPKKRVDAFHIWTWRNTHVYYSESMPITLLELKANA